MARTWLSVTVELLGGRGEDLWPCPGRVFAVGPSHTFTDLAEAVNTGFARWDRAHLSVFTLADARVVTDPDTGAELAESAGGPLVAPLDMGVARVARTVSLGAEFQFVFDLGDSWTHRCVVGQEKVDPLHVLGVRPEAPMAYWGWGEIPDQYGRRWSGDDGEHPVPPRPADPHPMLLRAWPPPDQVPVVDLRSLRAAAAAGDGHRVLTLISGAEVDGVLQQVGAALLVVLGDPPPRRGVEAVVVSAVNRLTWRAAAGDDVLAEDLWAVLRGEPRGGRVVPVDLEMLAAVLEGDLAVSGGGFLDLRTGRVHDDDATDPVMVGEDAVIDVGAEPGRWLRVDRVGSRAGWQDMVAFAEAQPDRVLRERLERATEGAGAFGRFRDVIHDHDHGLAARWTAFATDRQLGRARAFLAEHGIRAG